MDKRKNYNTVDICKLFMSVLVVIMHANTTNNSHFFNMMNYCVTPIAVPFFFIISGFFFKKGLDKQTNKTDCLNYLIQYEKKLFLLYFYWSILSFPITIVNYFSLYSGRNVFFILLIIFRRIFLCGEGVFWYILIMAESALVIYLVSRAKKSWLLIGMIVLGLLLGFLYDNEEIFHSTLIHIINKAFYIVFSWSNNFIMKGIPFMGIGYLICSIKNNKTQHVKKSFVIPFVVFLCSTIICVILYYINVNIGVFYIFQTVSISMFSLTCKININPNKTIIMRELSSSIYFMHTFFIYYFIEFFWGQNLFIPLKVIVAISLCTLVYVIIKLIVKKTNWRWLRIMFNIKG